MPALQQSFRKKSTKRFISISAAALILSTSGQAVYAISWRDFFLRGVQVIQLSNISTNQEIALGEQMHRNLLAQGMKLNRNSQLNAYVNRIGNRLTRVTKRDIPYRFHVVRNDAINAYATAGGYVYVTDGLMKAADNEAQLASVLAHEVGHIEEKHLINQIRKATLAQGLVSTALGSDRNVLANIGVELLVNRPQSREDEFDADEVGLKILRDADYSTAEMPRFMRKLLGGSRPPTFLSTHPAVPDRISHLEEKIQQLGDNGCNGANLPNSCGANGTAYDQAVRSYI